MISIYTNVLNTIYEVVIGTRKELGGKVDAENCGECYFYKKKIYVVSDVEMADNEDRDKYIKETLAHELSHAILYESGCSDYTNEELVHWLSVNVFKLNDLIGDTWINYQEALNLSSKRKS